ncbi:ABC transporter ATP-binding protein [Oscillibacter sp.]|uniref:ABC transporter ATP-binding protein n=1 Tax=Oscillibacter sp. TaxID=1945593 RepID=UPI00289B7EC8|nr:ABC transporter ATP-binding protein [Oscillibacter sp.]
MKNTALSVDGVTMKFNLAKENVDNLKEYVIRKIKRQLDYEKFCALQDISFTLEKGDSLAIIGKNGSGKSTLLKVISGIIRPTAGVVTVNGSIAPLIELGAGFDQDLTARENVFLNGAVLGYDKRFMRKKYDEIIDFAELWDFVDVPVKNFSTGMAARLGFSIATIITPEILIVDEILAVGDHDFQVKCEKKMSEMLSRGATLLFVSHSEEKVKQLCRRALWLDHGKARMLGPADAVCDAYLRS